MFDAGTLILFASASLLLALAPGPDNIFVLTQSALKGKLVGLVVTLGLCTGLVVHTSAVALGVAAIFQASALAFNLLKFAGAAYLLYLAWGAFRAGTSSLESEASREIGLGRFYLRGIIMNVTNPKVSIFFLAFLPQFTRPEQGHLPLQMFILGGIFILATLLVFGSVSLLAGVLGQWLRRSERAQKLLTRTAGAIFAALALKLATASR
ncbi:Lysine exporter protein (LYSE/YGGA) [Desulfobulbus propionicus DSM 2032]|uniref:Lysine exporter protein (LYSE/YGGA) n=1 Tax=Desulfobulbus propionicus (strain ATCC 33891 / DSM 2032 / VKM B-1956 / 1pr3) TaxID=577650 RepID=A0A7U3YMI7_DESPD|nr:LysE family translocator [Desulfobulbus propionicus]ADW18100.1 Lysine exporter protein (LYSE/YGGA) [Desulfobulbus propionicus DSM 2032]